MRRKLSAGLIPAVMACIGGFAILTGCKRPITEIGSSLQEEEDLLELVQVDTILLEMETVREDSLETDKLSTGLLGQAYHPGFGWHRGSLATQLRLSAPDIDFGTNPVVDSVFLQLKYTGDGYGQRSDAWMEVYMLEDSLAYDSSYFSNQVPKYVGPNLVDPAFQPIPLDPVAPVYVGDDTLGPQVRIYLTDEFGQTLLDKDPSAYASNDAWLEEFPGLYIKPSGGQFGTSAVGIDIANGTSGMRLFYHNDTDTLEYSFNINALAARINLFDHVWEGELEPFNDPATGTIAGDEALHIYSAGGAKVRFKLPDLAFLKDDPETVINKAELWLPVQDDPHAGRFTTPADLFVLLSDGDGAFISTPDQTSGAVNINGNFDESKNAYRFTLTSTFQQHLNGTLASDELFLVTSRGGISFQGVHLAGTEPLEGDTAEVPQHARVVLTFSH